jgi:Zn-dependent protease with chaperone function
MSSFLKTYLAVAGIISGIFLFFGLLFWALSKVFGENGPVISFAIILIIILSFCITAAIERG